MDSIQKQISDFTKTLFPDFETSKSYYLDKDLNSEDKIKRLIAYKYRSPNKKIKYFDYTKYLNAYDIKMFKRNIFKKFIYNGINSYLDILLEAYTRKILEKVLYNEDNIKIDITLFNKIIDEEINNLIIFLKNIPKQQSYILFSNNLIFNFQIPNQKFSDDLVVKTNNNDSISLIELKCNFDYIEVRKYKNILNTTFSLILGHNVEFQIDHDVFSLYFKNYGCSEEDINNIRDYYFGRSYKINLFGTKYKISETNISAIEDLYSICKNALQILDKDHYIKIAIDFYMDSLKNDKFGASKITYLMIALEALFNIDRNEISKTIRQRCIKLLQLFYTNDQVKQMEKDLKTGYTIRSCYAHGSKHTNPKAEFELVERLSEYTKTAILLLLQLNKNYKKAQINNLLDDSLLYKDSNSKLEEALKSLKVYFISDEEKTNIPIIDFKK